MGRASLGSASRTIPVFAAPTVDRRASFARPARRATPMASASAAPTVVRPATFAVPAGASAARSLRRRAAGTMTAARTIASMAPASTSRPPAADSGAKTATPSASSVVTPGVAPSTTPAAPTRWAGRVAFRTKRAVQAGFVAKPPRSAATACVGRLISVREGAGLRSAQSSWGCRVRREGRLARSGRRPSSASRGEPLRPPAPGNSRRPSPKRPSLLKKVDCKQRETFRSRCPDLNMLSHRKLASLRFERAQQRQPTSFSTGWGVMGTAGGCAASVPAYRRLTPCSADGTVD
jgi:hypothetical protein